MWYCLVLVGYRGVQDVCVVHLTVWITWCLSSIVRDVCEWHLRGWSERKEHWFLAQVAFGEGHHRWEFQGFW